MELAGKLNVLLANYSILLECEGLSLEYKKGINFSESLIKFEELYNDSLLKIDEIAERILTLGHTPIHNYST